MNRLLNKYQPVWESENESGSGEATPSGTTTQTPSGEQTPSGDQTPKPGEQTPKPGEEAKPGEQTPPGEEAKPGDEGPAPLTAESIQLPEGFEAPEGTLDSFAELINNAELSPQDRANKLVELHADLVNKQNEKLVQDWIDRQKADGEAIENDPEIGGDNFDASKEAFHAVLSEFGDDQLTQDLNATGMANKLSFAKFLVNIAKASSEGKPLVGGPTSGNEPQTAAEKLYPNQGKTT